MAAMFTATLGLVQVCHYPFDRSALQGGADLRNPLNDVLENMQEFILSLSHWQESGKMCISG